MMNFEILELATVYKDTWGRMKGRLETGEVADIVGKWPCSPQHIVIGCRFQSTLVKKAQKKPQYDIKGNTTSITPGLFALTNQLSQLEISHYTLRKMTKEQPKIYEYFQAHFDFKNERT